MNDELAHVVDTARDALPKAKTMLERTGTVFDKWPPPDDQMPPWGAHGREPWTPERLAELDAEVRWQGIAFSLYTNLVAVSEAVRAFDEASAPDADLRLIDWLADDAPQPSPRPSPPQNEVTRD